MSTLTNELLKKAPIPKESPRLPPGKARGTPAHEPAARPRAAQCRECYDLLIKRIKANPAAYRTLQARRPGARFRVCPTCRARSRVHGADASSPLHFRLVPDSTGPVYTAGAGSGGTAGNAQILAVANSGGAHFSSVEEWEAALRAQKEAEQEEATTQEHHRMMWAAALIALAIGGLFYLYGRKASST